MSMWCSTASVRSTGSVRRRAQLAHNRPDLTFTGLRGNIATRLGKVPAGGAILMAAAALARLDLEGQLVELGLLADHLPPSVMLPQVAQGAIVVETSADSSDDRRAAIRALTAATEHRASRIAVDGERAFLDELGGDCDLPAGAHATVDLGADAVTVEGLIASLDGHTVLRHSRTGAIAEATHLGRAVGRHLLDNGGAALLA